MHLYQSQKLSLSRSFRTFVWGNAERYDIRLRTDRLTNLWQSFLPDFIASPEWRIHQIPFDTVEAHKTEARFNPAHLRRNCILVIGRESKAEVAVANINLYQVNLDVD